MTDFSTLFDFSNALQFIIDLALVVLIGWLLGHERHEAGKIMGERSTIILIVGAYLFTYASLRVGNDHARVVAQIVSGVGFIGAGIIFKKGDRDIINLTTAILVWTVAALGVLVGLGLRFEAVVSSLVVFLVLLKHRKDKIFKSKKDEIQKDNV